MIPIAPISFLFLLMVVGVPVAGFALVLFWVVWLGHRWVARGRGQVLSRPGIWLWLVCALTLAANGWTLFLAYKFWQISVEIEQAAVNREARSRFILPVEFRYGEIVVPAGSRIERYDPYDNGEPDRPLGLSGLRTARFPHPIRIAGVEAIALQAFPPVLELASDQAIGPLHVHVDEQGWVPSPGGRAMACRSGMLARFEVPPSPEANFAERLSQELEHGLPDGPKADFHPGGWLFTGCEPGGPIGIPDVAAEP